MEITNLKIVLLMFQPSVVARGLEKKLVGEKEVWDDLVRVYKGISQFVWVYRPVEMNQLTQAIEKALTMKPAKQKQKRILIVDDDPDYARMVREWIKDHYRVDIVTAGMNAITFLLKVPEKEQVDMILLDYEMPVVDGPQVLQMLWSPMTGILIFGVNTMMRWIYTAPQRMILCNRPRRSPVALAMSMLRN